MRPEFTPSQLEQISGLPFISFCKSRELYFKDPEFTKCLFFNTGKVFVHGDTMIGMRRFPYEEMPIQLLAFDLKTEKVKWAFALTPTSSSEQKELDSWEYHVDKMGGQLIVQYVGERKALLLDCNTGEITSELITPHAPSHCWYEALHLTENGIGYQMAHDVDGVWKLIGGRIIDSKWNSTFEIQPPSGSYLPLSTHFGLEYDSELVLFGPTGSQITLKNVLSALAREDKLYLIEKNPDKKNSCLFTIRTLKEDETVVSDVEKSLVLDVPEASIKEVCENGEVILLTEKFLSRKSPVFVNLTADEVVYSQFEASEVVINQRNGELWSWDRISKEIRKISSKDEILMGSLSGEITHLLYVDQSDHLYFLGRP